MLEDDWTSVRDDHKGTDSLVHSGELHVVKLVIRVDKLLHEVLTDEVDAAHFEVELALTVLPLAKWYLLGLQEVLAQWIRVYEIVLNVGHILNDCRLFNLDRAREVFNIEYQASSIIGLEETLEKLCGASSASFPRRAFVGECRDQLLIGKVFKVAVLNFDKRLCSIVRQREVLFSCILRSQFDELRLLCKRYVLHLAIGDQSFAEVRVLKCRANNLNSSSSVFAS